MTLLTQQGTSSGFAGHADIGQEGKGQSLQLPGADPQHCHISIFCQAPSGPLAWVPCPKKWTDLMLPDLPCSFRFYTLSTLLLSLLNPSAPGSPAPLALPLSIILPFLPLQTFSQLFFQHSEQGYTAGLDQSWALICRELWRGKGGTGQGLQ